MQVDGETVTIDRTAPDLIRTIIADGQTITIDTTREGVRTLTVDGTEITIDRTEEANLTYILEDLVLNYSTKVGPSTIVDKSGEGNTATLYSGRGLTMDAVGDTVTYATGYSSASRTATLWGRFNTTSPVALLGSVSGSFIFTPTATGVWEELTSTATVEGDLAWDLGLDFDIGDLRVGTEHWTHSDWSDPTADGLNGKTIVDSGPNGYHGVCTGCSGFTGEATIPQTADRNWNKYQWFNGTNASVGLGAGDPLGFNGSGRIDFGCNIVIGAIPTSTEDIFYQYVSGNGVGFAIDIQSSGQVRVSGRSVLADGFQSLLSTTLVTVGETRIDAYIDYANDEIGISLNAGAYENGSAVFGQTSFTYGSSTNNTRIGNSQASARFFNGSVFNVEIQKDSVASNGFTGLGATPWKDTIGSNDGTEGGTFTRELVTASDANDQIDALGTAILEPRRNTQQLNLFGEGEYSRTPDSDSLDVTTEATWELWGNPYYLPASNQSWFSKTDISVVRSWQIYKDATQNQIDEFSLLLNGSSFGAEIRGIEDKISHIVFTKEGTTLLAYVDGVATTVFTIVGTVPASLNVSTEPVMIGARSNNVAGNFCERKIGSAKIYNRALTADEVLTNYNNQKSLYNL
jgi:hypothetical protein